MVWGDGKAGETLQKSQQGQNVAAVAEQGWDHVDTNVWELGEDRGSGKYGSGNEGGSKEGGRMEVMSLKGISESEFSEVEQFGMEMKLKGETWNWHKILVGSKKTWKF